MPFKIIRNDITWVSADAIVNTANPFPVIGAGTDSRVYKAAGEEKLLEARKKIGTIERGKCAWTESFHLKKRGIKYIIHTVGISYGDGKNGETEILRSCYSSSLNMAKELGCKSVAIPLLATGFYSFPKDIGLAVAVDEISRFIIENQLDVTLVVYDKESYLISEKLFDDIHSFIDENYIEESNDDDDVDYDDDRKFAIKSCCNIETGFKARKIIDETRSIIPIDVDAFITGSSENLNFQNTLQQLIADRQLKNAIIYSKAFIDRKFFSKIISTKDYVPKKMTVMALGLALELQLDEYEKFLASAGYAFMPSSKFDLIIKYCVMKGIYNLVEVDMILDSHGESCFSPQ